MDASYILSRIVGFLLQPGNLLLLVLLLATLFAWLRPGRRARFGLSLLSAALLFVTLAPVQIWLARPLETRFPVPAALPTKVDGILVLGGIVQRPIADDNETLAVNDSAERLMEGAALARRYPEARLVISGSGEDHRSLVAWLSHLGLARERIEFEAASINTFENARLSQAAVRPKAGETWLLVTSAQHMPRAVGVFRRLGWPVLPYPVDFRTVAPEHWWFSPNLAENLATIGGVLKEWAGLLAYYLLDRTDELWPGPT